MEIILLLEIFLITLFMISGISKFFSINQFKKTLIELKFSDYYSKILAICIPTIELLIAIFILFEKTIFIALISTLILSCLFLFVTMYSLITKKQIKCNCFGNFTDEKLGISSLFHIILLIVPALIILFNNNFNFIEIYSTSEIIFSIVMNLGLIMFFILINAILKYQKAIKLSHL